MTQTAAAVYATSASPLAIRFIASHEGFVSRAYRCPAGVWTIGYGFTMSSKVFAAYWLRIRGHALRQGDTITQAEADTLLGRLVGEDYAPPVARVLRKATQHAFDGASSVTFNCGPGALKWKWAAALAAGRIAEAAERLRSTAVTANGRRLPGLVRRRKEEAALIQHGDYGNSALGVEPASSPLPEDIVWYQKALQTLGLYRGAIDGKKTPATITAVQVFQANNDLVVDGIVGPATRATLIRALDARQGNQASVGTGVGTGIVEVIHTTAAPATSEIPASLPAPDVVVPPPTDAPAFGGAELLEVILVMLVIAGVVWGISWLLRNRGSLTGKRVPT